MSDSKRFISVAKLRARQIISCANQCETSDLWLKSATETWYFWIKSACETVDFWRKSASETVYFWIKSACKKRFISGLIRARDDSLLARIRLWELCFQIQFRDRSSLFNVFFSCSNLRARRFSSIANPRPRRDRVRRQIRVRDTVDIYIQSTFETVYLWLQAACETIEFRKRICVRDTFNFESDPRDRYDRTLRARHCLCLQNCWFVTKALCKFVQNGRFLSNISVRDTWCLWRYFAKVCMWRWSIARQNNARNAI